MSKKHLSTPQTAPVKKSAARFSARELALMFTHLQSIQSPTRDGLQRLLEMLLHQDVVLSEEALRIMWRVAQVELIVVPQEAERSEINDLRADLRRIEEMTRTLQAKYTLPHYNLLHADSPQMNVLAKRMTELIAPKPVAPKTVVKKPNAPKPVVKKPAVPKTVVKKKVTRKKK